MDEIDKSFALGAALASGKTTIEAELLKKVGPESIAAFTKAFNEGDTKMAERPTNGFGDSTLLWRVNSTSHKVNDAFDKARIEARDECLWLSNVCRQMITENDELRIKVSKMRDQIDELKKGNSRAEA